MLGYFVFVMTVSIWIQILFGTEVLLKTIKVLVTTYIIYIFCCGVGMLALMAVGPGNIYRIELATDSAMCSLHLNDCEREQRNAARIKQVAWNKEFDAENPGLRKKYTLSFGQ